MNIHAIWCITHFEKSPLSLVLLWVMLPLITWQIFTLANLHNNDLWTFQRSLFVLLSWYLNSSCLTFQGSSLIMPSFSEISLHPILLSRDLPPLCPTFQRSPSILSYFPEISLHPVLLSRDLPLNSATHSFPSILPYFPGFVFSFFIGPDGKPE